MKKFRSRERSLYTLLVKNYIIFTLVLGVLVFLIYLVEIRAQDSIIRSPQVDKPLGAQELLRQESYQKVNMNKLLGAIGYFEILDESGKVIYSDSRKAEERYTKKEVDYIPKYNANEYYFLSEYATNDGKVKTLVTKGSYNWETNHYEDNAFMVLDDELKVIESNIPWPAEQFTKRELGFLTMSENMFHDVYKYQYITRDGKTRTLIMHAKRMDRKSYEKLTSLWKFFLPIYLFTYIVITVFFTVWMHKKVKDPLDMLNEGILTFAEGNRDTEISYKGPREFETIFESFNKMSRQLKESESTKEKLIHEKQRMLADISHDLKTPITVIQGYARAICDNVADKDRELEYLNTIYIKTEGLTELINTFYDYSKLEHPEFTLIREEQDMAEYLREYLALKYDEIDFQGFLLEAEIPEEVIPCSFDGAQMRRVFENLISNALKHNPAGTVIYVSLTQTAEHILIQIGDSGRGIPAELRETIFEPFIVGDDSRNNKQGSGLGLAVAKKIVELHGGTLLLNESGTDIKTMFEIRL